MPQVKNIVLISRPIDFLFGIEISKKNPNKNFFFIIFPNSEKSELNAINFLKKKLRLQLTNVEFLFFKNYFKVDLLNLVLFKMYTYFKFSPKKKEVLITSGGIKARILYKKYQFEKLILTDEGTYSLKRIPEILKHDKPFIDPKNDTFKKLYRFFSIDNLQVNNFELSTMYDELLTLDSRVHHIKFEYLRNMILEDAYEVDDKEIIILGSNPNSLDITESEYKEAIQSVVEKLGNDYKVILKPHKTFPETYCFSLLNTDLPIEYFFMKRKKVPKYLYSFGSTSDRLLGYLFPEIKCSNILE